MNETTLPQNVRQHLRGLRHIGLITEDIQATLDRLQAIFGIADDGIVQVPEPGEPAETRFAFFSIGGVPYELIQPVSDHFRRLLLSRPAGINHVCYTVDDLLAAVAAMQGAGVRLGHVTPDGIVELPHMRMAYFDPRDTAELLIEFVEDRR